jgi:hypothetical protein
MMIGVRIGILLKFSRRQSPESSNAPPAERVRALFATVNSSDAGFVIDLNPVLMAFSAENSAVEGPI